MDNVMEVWRMSTVISFLGDDDWFKANWVVRRLFQDVKERFRLNEEDDYKFEQGLALNGMHFSLMKPEMRKRIMQMLKSTAIDLFNDKSGKYRGDFPVEQYLLYRNTMPSLIELLKKYENTEWPPEEEL
jgi:hypothetical protein